MDEEMVRIWGKMPASKAKKIKEWANSVGLPLMQFVSISVWVGAKEVMKTLEPEKSLDEVEKD